MKKYFFTSILLSITLFGCVSKKKYQAQVARYDHLKDSLNGITNQLDICLNENNSRQAQIKKQEEEIANLKLNANALLNQLSELSVISSTQAESIKKSIENINAKDNYIKGLQSAINRKDSLNLALVLNLKGALIDINDKDIQIKVDGTAVFVDISDKLLFKSGKYELSGEASEVLEKVAKVLNAQKDIQFMVEGHTDNKHISTKEIKDNWDLSVLRATSVVRTLQTKYGLDPAKMIAAGRAEYLPVESNNTEEGRNMNRRTRIVILPQLDQFFKLIESKN